MIKYAIYGAGSFGQEVFLNINDIIKKNNWQWEFIGFIDDGLAPGTKSKYGEVLGNIEFVNNVSYNLQLVIAITNPTIVKSIYNKINNSNINFPNIIHPSISFMDESSLSIGKGNVVANLGLISFDTEIGDFNIFNTRVSVGHHVKIGSFNVFHPNTQISGNVKIGDSNIFGFNSGIMPGKKIGNLNTFAPGCIVTRNMADECLYIGNPARKIEI